MIGYMLDERSGSDNAKQDTDSAQRGYAYNRKKSGEAYQNQGRVMFLDALLELSAHIIQADGRIMHSEMETVREFLRQSFGPQTMEACNKRLLTIFQERKSLSERQSWQRVYNSCQTLRMSMNQETCLQLMAYLAEIAKADGKIGDDGYAQHSLCAWTKSVGGRPVAVVGWQVDGRRLQSAWHQT